jgi:hypothetical protein
VLVVDLLRAPIYFSWVVELGAGHNDFEAKTSARCQRFAQFDIFHDA